jgi:molecular chaperone GrpE (heat shock protein)
MEIQESESNELLRLELQFALKFLPCMGGVVTEEARRQTEEIRREMAKRMEAHQRETEQIRRMIERVDRETEEAKIRAEEARSSTKEYQTLIQELVAEHDLLRRTLRASDPYLDAATLACKATGLYTTK